MIDVIVNRLPSLFTLFFTLLAFLIPYLTYKINQKIHSNVDPPWMVEEKEKSKEL